MTWCYQGNLPFEITHPLVFVTHGWPPLQQKPSLKRLCRNDLVPPRKSTTGDHSPSGVTHGWPPPYLKGYAVARITNNMAILVHVWNFCVTGSLVCAPLLIALQIGNQPDISTFWIMEYVE